MRAAMASTSGAASQHRYAPVPVVRNETGMDTPNTAARQMLRTVLCANTRGGASVRYRCSRRISRMINANDAAARTCTIA